MGIKNFTPQIWDIWDFT